MIVQSRNRHEKEEQSWFIRGRDTDLTPEEHAKRDVQEAVEKVESSIAKAISKVLEKTK